MSGITENQRLDFCGKVFGTDDMHMLPSSAFQELLHFYAEHAEVYATRLVGEGVEVIWLDGTNLGVLSTPSREADAPVAGSVHAIASVRKVKLGGVLEEREHKTGGIPSIVVMFGDGSEVEVGPDHRDGRTFITGLLSRL